MLKATSAEQVRTRLEKAIKLQYPVTLTYFEEEKDAETGKRTGRKNADGTKVLVETVRTIEPTEIRETRDGNLIVRATDRKDGKTKSWRLDRIKTYTIHRTAFTADRSESSKEIVVMAKDHGVPTTTKPSKPWRVILDGRDETSHTSEKKAYAHLLPALREGRASSAKIMQWERDQWRWFDTVTADDF